MLKLTKNVDQSIPVSQMKDGDVAIIIKWTVDKYVGQVVQRYKQQLVTLGGSWGNGWSDYFDNPQSPNISCRVRILESGEILCV